MFKYAYDTKPCADYVLDRIRKALQIEMIERRLFNVEDLSDNIILVTGQNPDVPIFAHPFPVEEERDLERGSIPSIAIDIRGFTRIKDGRLIPTAQNDLRLIALRAAVNNYWVTETPRDLLNLSDYPMRIYARWVSENLTRRLGLDPQTQMRVSIIAAVFYASLFLETDEWDERTRLKVASLVGRATMTGIEQALEIIDPLEDNAPTGIESLVEMLQQHGESVRLEKVSVPLLYTILGGTWFGANSKENIAVALEHPPTFLSILFEAVDNRTYRKANLSEIAERANRKDAAKQFTTNFARLIKPFHLSL